MPNRSTQVASPAASPWWLPSTFTDEERALQAQNLRKLGIGSLLVWGAGLFLLVILQPDTLRERATTMAVLAGFIVLTLELGRRGRTTLASWILVLGMVFLLSHRAWNLGGLQAPVVPLFVVSVMMGGLLLGKIGGFGTGAVCLAISIALIEAADRNMLPPTQFTFPPSATLAFIALPIALTLLLQDMVAGTVRRSLAVAKRELRERRRTQERLELALEVGQIGMWESAPGSSPLQANSVMVRRFALPEQPGEQAPMEALWESVHPEDRDRVMAERRRLDSGEVRRCKFAYRILRDGEVRYVESAAAWIEERGDDGEGRLAGVNVDVTEHRRAEHALRERVKELQLLHGFAKLLQTGGIPARNLPELLAPMIPPSWQYPECCVARVVFDDVVACTPGWRETSWMMSSSFTTGAGDGVIQIAYTQECPPADEGPFLREERDILERLSQMVATYVDRTLQREALERLVVTRTVELKAARDAADGANQAKTTFLANMSHEIRTPLNAVLGYSQLLLRERDLDAVRRMRVETIHRSGSHLLGLINDILDLSKIEAGYLSIDPAPFGLGAGVESVAAMFRQQLSDRGIALDVHLADDLPQAVLADAGRVRQVLVNVLGNAAKFTVQGRIDLEVRAEAASADRVRIEVVVRDTGCGIPAEDLPGVFDAFMQGAQGLKAGGTGLGMAISRRLARAMGGDLAVESALGVGTTFTFTFEAGVTDQMAPTVAPSLPTGLAPGSHGRRVMVVDDVETNRDVLDSFLRPLGFEVLCLEGAVEALDRHDSWKPDVILMDLRMPDMDGREAICRLRESGRTTPVMVVTASSMTEDRRTTFAAGANDFLPKPFEAADLYDKLGRLAKVDYLYAESTVVDEGPVAAAATREAVPLELRRAIREATRSARVDRLEALLDEAARDAPVMAAKLRRLADDFRFEALLESLDALDPS